MMDSHNRLICPYCNKVCVRFKSDPGSRATRVYKQRITKRRHLSFTCPLCHTSFITKLNGCIIATTCEWIQSPDRYYTGTVFHNKKYTEIICYTLKNASKKYIGYVIYQASQSIQFTPQNFQTKLNTILTFL